MRLTVMLLQKGELMDYFKQLCMRLCKVDLLFYITVEELYITFQTITHHFQWLYNVSDLLSVHCISLIDNKMLNAHTQSE